MIIDIHAHVVARPELYAYKSGLLANRGANGKDDPGISDELLEQHALQQADGQRRHRHPAAVGSAVPRRGGRRVRHLLDRAGRSSCGLVRADGDGVVIVARSRAEEVIDLAEGIEAREPQIRPTVLDGLVLSQARSQHGYFELQLQRRGQ